MKSFLLTIATIAAGFSALAQDFEVGINGGMSSISKPIGALYQGKQEQWRPLYNVNFHYNFAENWQVGLSASMTDWQRSENWPLIGNNGEYLSTEKVDFILAKRAVTVAFECNFVIPIYTRFEDLPISKIYFGIAAGPVVTGNDGEIKSSRVNPNTPSEFVYVSSYSYQSGYGGMLGAQLGFTQYVSEHFGIDAKVAPSISWVKTVDSRLGYANSVFNTTSVPVTLGIHYRF